MQGKLASNRVRTNSDKLNRTLHRAFSSIKHVYQRDETAKQIRARHAQHLHLKHSFYLYLTCAMRGLELSDESEQCFEYSANIPCKYKSEMLIKCFAMGLKAGNLY